MCHRYKHKEENIYTVSRHYMYLLLLSSGLWHYISGLPVCGGVGRWQTTGCKERSRELKALLNEFLKKPYITFLTRVLGLKTFLHLTIASILKVVDAAQQIVAIRTVCFILSVTSPVPCSLM